MSKLSDNIDELVADQLTQELGTESIDDVALAEALNPRITSSTLSPGPRPDFAGLALTLATLRTDYRDLGCLVASLERVGESDFNQGNRDLIEHKCQDVLTSSALAGEFKDFTLNDCNFKQSMVRISEAQTQMAQGSGSILTRLGDYVGRLFSQNSKDADRLREDVIKLEAILKSSGKTLAYNRQSQHHDGKSLPIPAFLLNHQNHDPKLIDKALKLHSSVPTMKDYESLVTKLSEQAFEEWEQGLGTVAAEQLTKYIKPLEDLVKKTWNYPSVGASGMAILKDISTTHNFAMFLDAHKTVSHAALVRPYPELGKVKPTMGLDAGGCWTAIKQAKQVADKLYKDHHNVDDTALAAMLGNFGADNVKDANAREIAEFLGLAVGNYISTRIQLDRDLAAMATGLLDLVRFSIGNAQSTTGIEDLDSKK